jgi:hypothetical protein
LLLLLLLLRRCRCAAIHGLVQLLSVLDGRFAKGTVADRLDTAEAAETRAASNSCLLAISASCPFIRR